MVPDPLSAEQNNWPTHSPHLQGVVSKFSISYMCHIIPAFTPNVVVNPVKNF